MGRSSFSPTSVPRSSFGSCAARIARFEKERIGAVSLFTLANELSILRHMLHKAKKWGNLDSVPDFYLPKRPKGENAMRRRTRSSACFRRR